MCVCVCVCVCPTCHTNRRKHRRRHAICRCDTHKRSVKRRSGGGEGGREGGSRDACACAEIRERERKNTKPERIVKLQYGSKLSDCVKIIRFRFLALFGHFLNNHTSP